MRLLQNQRRHEVPGCALHVHCAVAMKQVRVQNMIIILY